MLCKMMVSMVTPSNLPFQGRSEKNGKDHHTNFTFQDIKPLTHQIKHQIKELQEFYVNMPNLNVSRLPGYHGNLFPIKKNLAKI